MSLSELHQTVELGGVRDDIKKVELKNSRAYISAMKALQNKLKTLENETSQRIKDLEEGIKTKEIGSIMKYPD